MPKRFSEASPDDGFHKPSFLTRSDLIVTTFRRFRIIHSVAAWLDRLQPPAPVMLGGLALLVGLASGVGIWLFKHLIKGVHHLTLVDGGELLDSLGVWGVALVPMLGGLIVGLMGRYLIGRERREGVSGIIESVALAGGRLRYRLLPAKTTAAAISIGSGASVGPEDPSVQIGSNIGSMLGQWFNLSDERVRSLVAAGAAAGIAAAFNAPFAGVFFALELILGEIGGSALSVVVMAAVVSSVFTQAVEGPQPAFHVPAYELNSVWELGLYFGLGALAGPISALYVKLLYLAHDLFGMWRVPRWIKPAAAGLAVGIVGIFLPEIFGVGYETIGGILNGVDKGLLFLLLLLAAKLVLTPISIGGGFYGGVFAPSLFLGAALGAAYGTVAEFLFPGLGIMPPAFAMVGMAATLAGAVHAPLTAILLLFEMTHDYRIVLPLMFAVVISMLISQRIRPESVYTLGLLRKGIRISRGRDVDLLDSITVGEVMRRVPETLHETDSIIFAKGRLLHLHSHGLPVLNADGDLAGILTVGDIEEWETGHEEPEGRHVTVAEICTRDVVTTRPDETIGEALRKMGVRDIGRLPVVDPRHPKKLLGILRRTEVVQAYDAALSKRAGLRHKARQVRIGEIGRVDVHEITIEKGSLVVGHTVSQIAWPRDCVIASIQRKGRLLIPRGDTVLMVGDVLAVVAEEGGAIAKVREISRGER